MGIETMYCISCKLVKYQFAHNTKKTLRRKSIAPIMASFMLQSCVCHIRMDPSQLTLLSNNSALAGKFDTLEKHFGLLYGKRAFVHWFVGEGGSEGDWSCFRYETRLLVKDYNEVATEDDEEGGASVE